jgi:hypothetical protein
MNIKWMQVDINGYNEYQMDTMNIKAPKDLNRLG